MVIARWVAPALLFSLLAPAGAEGTDRLPPKLRGAYKVALGEVKDYVRYILEKVWRPRLAEVRAKNPGVAGRGTEAQTAADDIVHILLPHLHRPQDGSYFPHFDDLISRQFLTDLMWARSRADHSPRRSTWPATCRAVGAPCAGAG